MHRQVLLLLGICSVTVFCEQNEETESDYDYNSKKEASFKKFIGETEYRIPFKTRIAMPFQIGQTLHLLGTVNDDPKRIEVNFHKGAEENVDMPLHLSMRFKSGIFGGKLIYNAFKNGRWMGNEQRVKNPYKANGEIDLRIRILDGKYTIYCNRVETATFNQKIPLDGVDHVSVDGSLATLKLFHYGGRIFPLPYAGIVQLTPGRRLDISAMPTGNRVNIGLYNRNYQYVLQLSIRYDEKAIIRNALLDGKWGTEEREGGFPLKRNELFDLTIVNEPYSFQLFFNGNRFGTFAHRGSPEDVDTLKIDGDAEIFTVTVNNIPSFVS